MDGQRREKKLSEQITLQLSKSFNAILVGHLKHYKSFKAEYIAAALAQSVIDKKTCCSIYLSDKMKTITLS
jgi:hypothetical protein